MSTVERQRTSVSLAEGVWSPSQPLHTTSLKLMVITHNISLPALSSSHFIYSAWVKESPLCDPSILQSLVIKATHIIKPGSSCYEAFRREKRESISLWVKSKLQLWRQTEKPSWCQFPWLRLALSSQLGEERQSSHLCKLQWAPLHADGLSQLRMVFIHLLLS